MNNSSLTPLALLQIPEEVSQLRSPRDSATIYNAWKREKLLVAQVNKLSNAVNQLNRDIKSVGSRKVLNLNLAPFAIYTIPNEFLPPDTGSANWRTVSVRGGYAFLNTFDTSSTFVNGTDRMEAVAYSDYLPSPINTGQYVLPPGESQTYLWIEYSGSTVGGSSYFLRYSADPDIPDDEGNPNGWTNWPSTNGNYSLIGWVDTSSSINIQSIVRQVQVGDILPIGPTFTASLCSGGINAPYVVYGYPSGSTV